MTRVRVLTSTGLDGDVKAQLATLRTLPRVTTFDENEIRENSLPLIFAAAAQLFRDRPRDCPVVTAGEAPLVAASIVWRGPIVHVPVAPMSRLELSLLRRRRPGGTRLVVSSWTAARRATTRGVLASNVHVIRPQNAVSTPLSREAARAALGLKTDELTIFIPGTILPGSGHQLALWSSGILSVRDARVRVIMRPDPRETVTRFADSVLLPNALVTARDLDDGSLAAAADVVLLASTDAPPMASIADIAAIGTPIVARRKLWDRERLGHIPARLVDSEKPRLIARATLEVLESLPPHRSAVGLRAFDADAAQRGWLTGDSRRLSVIVAFRGRLSDSRLWTIG